MPTARVLVVKVACPEASVPVPTVIEPSEKVTVPVGEVAPEAGWTTAVKVMLVPVTAVPLTAEEVTVVVVEMMGGAVMVTETADEALLLKAVGVVAPA